MKQWLLTAGLIGFAALAIILPGEHETVRTQTVVLHPASGPISREAASDPLRSKQNYHPLHGNAEHAVFRSGGGCGVERWAVKTLTDPAASNVTLTPQPTSIADLVSIAPPVEPTDRVNPTEETTFSLSGVITFVKEEADSDVHMVVKDAQGNSMIVESPAPTCAQNSRVLAQLEAVRTAVDQRFSPTGSPQSVSVPVTLTGVGFFDRLHGQTGVAPNGIELHPLLSITFSAAP